MISRAQYEIRSFRWAPRVSGSGRLSDILGAEAELADADRLEQYQANFSREALWFSEICIRLIQYRLELLSPMLAYRCDRGLLDLLIGVVPHPFFWLCVANSASSSAPSNVPC